MLNYYPNFLDINLIDSIEKYVEKNISLPTWKSSLYWPNHIRHSSALVQILPLPHIEKELRPYYSKILPETQKLHMEINYYIWPPLSYIPSHNDNHVEEQIASSIYLNKEWNIDHGGLFLYNKENKIYAIPPIFNSCIINNNHVTHSTTLITTNAPYRRTLQIFFYDIKYKD